MTRKLRVLIGVFALFVVTPFSAAMADSGLYVGGGVGNAGIELDFQDAGFNLPDFDEDDFAWKVMAGYNLDLLTFDLGVELAYVDFGQPSGDIPVLVDVFNVELDTTAIALFGVAGFDLGPVGVFGKLGYVSWDLDATISAVGIAPDSFSDDGSDLAYGAGVRFNLGSLEVRGEYEIFDVEDTDISMVSASLVYHFD